MIELVDGLCDNRYNINYIDVYEKIYHMMGHEPGIKEIYYSKQDRLYASNPMCLILLNGKPIGFLNLVQEDINNIKFIDGAIIDKYRNKGYGTEAIKILRPDLFNSFIVGEILRTNLSANCMGQKLATHIYVGEKSNYYLFQPKRLDEFISSSEFQELKAREKRRKIITKRLY